MKLTDRYGNEIQPNQMIVYGRGSRKKFGRVYEVAGSCVCIYAYKLVDIDRWIQSPRFVRLKDLKQVSIIARDQEKYNIPAGILRLAGRPV